MGLASIGARAQPTIGAAEYKGYFHYMYENDLFTATDRYYTQGSIVEFSHPVFGRSPIWKALSKILKGQSTEHIVSFRQDVFTPKSIRNKTLDSTDRPYAGTFFFSQKAIARVHGFRISQSLDLGCIGPSALGEQMQKFTHAHTNNSEPIGWENQVANSFIANYDLWVQQSVLKPGWFDLMFEYGGRAGLLYTNASAGLKMRLGRMNSLFRDPVINEGSYKTWELFATLSGNATYVQYNAVLQGVPWAKSVHVLAANKLERVLYKLDASINFYYKHWGLVYTNTFITPEFEGGLPHAWGGCNIYYRF